VPQLGDPAIQERARSLSAVSSKQKSRRTNDFSKKLESHGHAVSLHFMHYNYCRIHETLRCTPAMESGLSDHVWSIEELCALLPKPVVSKSTIEHDLRLKALGTAEAST
jgi:hypothetical protein